MNNDKEFDMALREPPSLALLEQMVQVMPKSSKDKKASHARAAWPWKKQA